MNTRVFMVLTSLLAISGAPALAAEPSPGAIVGKVDALRLPREANLRIGMVLESRKGTKSNGGSSYVALIRAGVGTLVQAVDGEQRGQKYLSTAAGYWMYAPRTKRALRLTPLQLLRGQASIGDVSRLRYADDYTVAFADSPRQTIDGVDCWMLTLGAKSPQATYASIALAVNRATGNPVRAQLKARSGRLLKTATFGPIANISGYRVVKATTYTDGVDSSKATTVTYNSIAKAATPVGLFKPQSLSVGS
ncbi:MAG TPA: outer membrane lipoprotein-sorting protein [Allosphingosinicella sp.]|nr:outer membrane lipoprotein-sorting protein [Allosphingosinicella sp.]